MKLKGTFKSEDAEFLSVGKFKFFHPLSPTSILRNRVLKAKNKALSIYVHPHLNHTLISFDILNKYLLLACARHCCPWEPCGEQTQHDFCPPGISSLL
jgi:hypothetical protein